MTTLSNQALCAPGGLLRQLAGHSGGQASAATLRLKQIGGLAG